MFITFSTHTNVNKQNVNKVIKIEDFLLENKMYLGIYKTLNKVIK